MDKKTKMVTAEEQIKIMREDEEMQNCAEYDFIDWIINYGSPVISELRKLRFDDDEIADCFDYSIFSLEKAIATKDNDIVVESIVDSLNEMSKIIKRKSKTIKTKIFKP